MDPAERARAKADRRPGSSAEEDLTLLGWRTVPTDPVGAGVGQMALDVMPAFEQLFLAGPAGEDGDLPFGLDLDRMVYPARKRIEHETAAGRRQREHGVYFAVAVQPHHRLQGHADHRATAGVLRRHHRRADESAVAIVHSRFSTNTFPAWPLAHPFRYIAHNGEINTVRGNRNRMRAREAMLSSKLIPGDLARAFPICHPGRRRTRRRSTRCSSCCTWAAARLPHAVLMMIPEAWENNATMDPSIRGFAEFHASLIEPWDGPACVTFTDGTVLGAVLDRNGLRPGRWWLTTDDTVVLASEAGVLPIPPEKVLERGRLQPGRMFLVDTDQGRILNDAEVKDRTRRRAPVPRLGARRPDAAHRPAAPRARHRLAPQRAGPAEDLRLHRGRAADAGHPDGRHRRRGHRLDGHRHPGGGAVHPSAADLRLLQPAVRAGSFAPQVHVACSPRRISSAHGPALPRQQPEL